MATAFRSTRFCVFGFADRITSCFGFVVFATAFLAMSSLEGVAGPVEDRVVVRMELEHGSVVLHEPVFATFVVQNTQPERLEFDLGSDSKTTFAFSITEPDGRTVHLPPFQTPDGVSASGRVALENGLTYTQKMLLNEWYDFSSAGRYSIAFHTSAVLRTGSGRAVESTPIEPIFLEVQPRDEDRLQSICNDLATAALTSSLHTRKRETAAAALSYVKDPVAIPFLRQLLERGPDVVALERYAVEGLTRIGTDEAIGVLIESYGAEQFRSSQPEIGAGLQRVRAKTTDDELKNRIDAALAAARLHFLEELFAR